MDYPLENLPPEKFQRFVQALLTKEFPNLQCFPVAQPDGGRDAAQMRLFDPKHSFVMFQVKFVRAPYSIDDPHKWLLSTIEKESPKVKGQILEGAKQYILITNVSGTAHPRAGSIDTMTEMLSRVLGIPSACWWRDDLCRRLDSSWDLKWSYPELMTGPDLIRYLIENGLSEAKERRAHAIRSFIMHQYSTDQEVKFKQVELQNKLLDLFVDVPIERGFRPFRKRSSILQSPQENIFFEDSEVFEARRHFYPRHVYTEGAADIMLQHESQPWFRYVVLEGAPGQGKSTVVQYLCQVHRMRLLDIQEDIQRLRDSHRTSPLRLPIKVDLRDLASWLARRNPFTPDGEEIPSNEWTRSMEGFLAALLRHQSGGLQFEVADLHAVAKLSAILIVFDGLDEVADIDRRQEVVDEITKGIVRLEATAASVQVIVTSRPAAFANSPGLPPDKFLYFELADLTPPLIDQYAERWLRARRLHDRESAEVKRILREKLAQPHLRDLARNPMQLAILLSLIHTRGSSLPDKRTALYDNYIDLFFNREAEKSPVVRDNRELLINIHRYLAWLLHGEAELGDERDLGRGSGAITGTRLVSVLQAYLEDEGYDSGLAQTLFTGMVERVVALVSRVQGTYEFEVQPLREYFAARFLYETAPYSPPGAEKRGTKPDRFDAIARDFYWLNVSRFYAGCYSKGELVSLIDRLQDLTKDDDYGLTSHPRVLGAILLSDWVFSQHPKSVTEVVNLILDGLGLRFLLTSNSRRAERSSPLVLPRGSGQQELVDRCVFLLRQQPPLDYALDIIDLLKANISTDDILPVWLDACLTAQSTEKTRWMEYGLQLGCLSKVPIGRLNAILSGESLESDRIGLLLRAKRLDFLESHEERFSKAINSILNRDVEVNSRSRPVGTVDLLAQCLNVRRYAASFDYPHSAALSATWRHARPQVFSELLATGRESSFQGVKKCLALLRVVQNESKRAASEWATELSPWDTVIEKGRELWGDRWSLFHIANVASGIKSSKETCTDCSDFFDNSKSLCKRSRYARLRAGSSSWWQKGFHSAENLAQKMHLGQIWLTWASETSLIQSVEEFNVMIGDLDMTDWYRFFDSVQCAINNTRSQSRDRLIDMDLSRMPAAISPRTCVALALRSRPRTRRALYTEYLQKYEGNDLRILEICQNIAVALISDGDEHWLDCLRMVAQCFEKGVVTEPFAYQHFIRYAQGKAIPLDYAVSIIKNADKYPTFLVAIAESRCRENAAKKILPVRRLAERDGWFDVG